MIFKVVTKWPEDVSRSHNGGDYRRGYWLYPEKSFNGVLLYRKEYFSSYEGGSCPVAGSPWPCEQCQGAGHEPQEYEKVSAFEVLALLEKHPHKVHANIFPCFVRKYGKLDYFYVEIDATTEKEGFSTFRVQHWQKSAFAFWKEVNSNG